MVERPSNLSTASDGTAKEYCGAVRRRAYQDAAYWTTRYGEDAEPFDWYLRYASFKGVLDRYVEKKKKAVVLDAGCGTSTVGADLVADGYKNVTCVDNCGAVVDAMKAAAIKAGARGPARAAGVPRYGAGRSGPGPQVRVRRPSHARERRRRFRRRDRRQVVARLDPLREGARPAAFFFLVFGAAGDDAAPW